MSHMKELRQGMYKMRSPSWKDAYRNRCLDRLRENRSRCYALRRGIHQDSGSREEDKSGDVGQSGGGGEGEGTSSGVRLSIHQIMEQEWDQMTGQMGCKDQKSQTNADYIDSMVLLYDEICWELKKDIETDLKKEEEQLLRLQEVYEAELERAEEELCAAVKNMSTDEVVCPLCEKSSLIEHKGVILCKCGLRMDTEQDGITLQNIKSSLEAGVSEHSSQCEAKPHFSLTHKFGIYNIIMSCQECDFLYVIV